jgi:two-component system sensor histidine kinase ChvG
MAPVDLGRLLTALVEVHEAAAAPGRPAIALQAPAAGEMMVIGNEGRLVQVFQNLVANAMSFSPGDGTVTMTASRTADMIEVTVEDEGPGIPEGSLESIFERFYTERPEGERFGTHSGLGLSISRQVVEAHGGFINAENRRRADGGVEGARFRVGLPAG